MKTRVKKRKNIFVCYIYSCSRSLTFILVFFQGKRSRIYDENES